MKILTLILVLLSTIGIANASMKFKEKALCSNGTTANESFQKLKLASKTQSFELRNEEVISKIDMRHLTITPDKTDNTVSSCAIFHYTIQNKTAINKVRQKLLKIDYYKNK